MIEGGQSATGALLDKIVRTHGNGLEPTPGTHELVLDRIEQLIAEQGETFGAPVHVLPDFHGNRAPLADARATGTIHGLTLDGSFDGMCAIYYRAMVSLALGIRQILDLMEFDGPVTTIHLGGGHARNRLLARLYADATRRPVAISAGEEAMLLGTAMIAATAAGLHPPRTILPCHGAPNDADRAERDSCAGARPRLPCLPAHAGASSRARNAGLSRAVCIPPTPA